MMRNKKKSETISSKNNSKGKYYNEDNDEDNDEDDEDEDNDEDEDDEDDDEDEDDEDDNDNYDNDNNDNNNIDDDSDDNNNNNDGDIYEDKVDDLNYDLYNLAAQNAHTLRSEDNKDKLEKVLVENTQRALQLLIKKLFELPTEITEVGPVAILPNPFTAIPREKRIPDPKPETKWEKFAKEKGIKNKKRERMIFDEVDQQYKPRYGYKRANNGIQDIPIVEIKAGDDPYKDPWTEEKQMKKQKVEKIIYE
jgi:hypothetical protein